jgi:hypothetical protein
MSDSLSETLIVICEALMISMKPLVELAPPLPAPVEDEAPLAAASAAAAPPDAAPPDEAPPAEAPPDEELAALVPLLPADTESPGEMLASETTVPLIGAYSLVSARVCLALATAASALSTAAWSEAIEPAGEPLEPPDPEALERVVEDPAPEPVAALAERPPEPC